MKIFKHISLTILAILILSSVAYAVIFPHIINGMMIEDSEFEKIKDHVFVSPKTTEGQKDSLLAYLDTAHFRNQQFWGKRIAYPNILFCHDSEIAEKYGYGGSPASFFMTPFYSFVLIAPEGLHPEVISHEMCHPELFERSGWISHKMSFPVWFFEGMAMQVDHRSYYSDSTWQAITDQGKNAPALNEIDELSEFFNDNYQLNYSTAKHEVNRWLSIVGKEGLEELIEKAPLGDGFYELYQEIEKKAQ